MFAVISFVLALCWCVYQIESADTIIFPPTNGESHQLPVIPRSPEAPEISTAEDIHSVFDIGKRSIHSEKKAGDVCFISATGEDGICGDLKDCPPHQKLLSYILQHGSRASKLALDVLRNAICGYIKNVPLVCCPSASRRSQKPHSKAPAEPQAPILQVSTPASAALHSKVEGKSNDRCGFSAAFHQRVVGGNPAAIGAWPWAALFYLKENQGRQSGAVAAFCGATLIDRSGWILTAAHCFDTNPDFYVRLGEHDLHKDNEIQHFDFHGDRSKVFIHPQYRANGFSFDIALVKVDINFDLPDHIQPVCLPSSEISSLDLVGRNPFVIGWGKEAFSNQEGSNILLEASIEVRPTDKCAALFRRKFGPNAPTINESQICAERGGVDACSGDSGGGLFLEKPESYFTVIGVTSFGYKCAVKGFPGVYTRVSHFLPWIREVQTNYRLSQE